MKVWKKIKGFEDFEINQNGIIRDKKTLFLRKQYIGKNGYYSLRLNKKLLLTHRLIAIAFIENKFNKPHINHKNGIKTDNRIENLEWCTHKENMRHAWDNGLSYFTKEARLNSLISSSKKVIDTDSGIIYNSITEASILLGFNYKNLSRWLNGKVKNKSKLKYYDRN